MATTSSHRTTRAHRRDGHHAQYLVTADQDSLLELETFLATLPLCAAGRVFIEVASPAGVTEIDAPKRMTVTWLVREGTNTRLSARPGELVSRAACGWADEMLCDDDSDTKVMLLGGYLGTADIADHLVDDLGIAPGKIATPERFGLSVGR